MDRKMYLENIIYHWLSRLGLDASEQSQQELLDAITKAIGHETNDLRSENARLREALEKVAKLEGMTLLGDPADYDFDAEEAYSSGALHAFCDAAGIAKDALSPGTEER